MTSVRGPARSRFGSSGEARATSLAEPGRRTAGSERFPPPGGGHLQRRLLSGSGQVRQERMRQIEMPRERLDRLPRDHEHHLRDVRGVLRQRDEERLRGRQLLVRSGLPARGQDRLGNGGPSAPATGARAGGARSTTTSPPCSRYAPRTLHPSGKGRRRSGCRGPSRTAEASVRRNATSSDVAESRASRPGKALPPSARRRARRAGRGSVSEGRRGSAERAPAASLPDGPSVSSRDDARSGGRREEGRGGRSGRGRSGAA